MNKSDDRGHVGRLGESIAAEFLEQKGFRVIARNYRRPWGEIDIIAEREGGIRFVEVKTVSREAGELETTLSREMNYRPEEMADSRKLKKVARTATLYMEEKKDDREYQIDVVGVILHEDSRTAHCRLFEQVLEDNL